MSGQLFTRILFFIWLALFAGSFIMTAITPSKDFGLSAGFDRVEIFFKWQFWAGVIGIFLWLMGRRNFEKGTLWRWLSRSPGIFAVFLALMVFFLIMGANLGKPKSGEYYVPPDRPTTAPAEPVRENPPPAIKPQDPD